MLIGGIEMKLGVIIETKEYEKAWNAMRFAVTAKKNGHEVKVFLMGEGVEIENLTHEKFNVSVQVKAFNEAGGDILACGTDVCPISTMIDCVEMVVWADKAVTF